MWRLERTSVWQFLLTLSPCKINNLYYIFFSIIHNRSTFSLFKLLQIIYRFTYSTKKRWKTTSTTFEFHFNFQPNHILRKHQIVNIYRVSNNSELKGAPDIAKKCTNRCTIYYPPKSAIFLLQSAHFLISYTIFIAFLCINFLEMSNFANSFFKFFSFSIISH